MQKRRRPIKRTKPRTPYDRLRDLDLQLKRSLAGEEVRIVDPDDFSNPKSDVRRGP